ncbi:MAG: choice-of-anchor L domain-containing protein [Flavobacteriales bacterium]|nr:choice-of-anchor L domain-containing protein [Flavobacteriales bacterium]
MSKKLSFFIISFLFSTFNFAQISINTTGNYSNPTYLIDNALIGNGVVTSNHSFIGDPSQIGFFSDSLGLIGMDSGFVLTTGGVDSIGNLGFDTLFGFPQTYNLATDLFGGSDADLLTIANSVPAMIGQTFVVSSTHDVAILEFDFVPSSDTVKFNYVFASEEYLQYVNSTYNDVFAFLISGPGITGPYASPVGFPNGAINIAEVPNSNPSLPITISTINDTLNSQFYNYDTMAVVSAFNGYTDVFTAKAAVTACATYHIKLAIADGSDGTLDSGVFFEAGSFNSTEPGAPNAIVSTTDVLCNGDSSGTASVCIQGGTSPYTINWNGQNPNALLAGTYFVTITDAIGAVSSPNYTINEPSILLATISQPIIDLEANAIGGAPTFTYQWVFANVVVGTNSTYTTSQNGDYTVVVTDANGCIDTSALFTVTNIVSGINELLSTSLIVYPNPFSHKTTIKLLNETDIVKEISLYNPIGQKVKAVNIDKEGGNIILEKGNLAKGIYMLVIRTENYTSKSKLIIE